MICTLRKTVLVNLSELGLRPKTRTKPKIKYGEKIDVCEHAVVALESCDYPIEQIRGIGSNNESNKRITK